MNAQPFGFVPTSRADGVPDVATYAALAAIGVTRAQADQLTGFGLAVDGVRMATIAAKYAAGALSAEGVMSVLYGVDSPQHHAGTAILPGAWDERMEAKRDRLEDRAARLAAESSAKLERGRTMLDAIPFGQPILSDHYSAGRDRNYRDRARSTMSAGFALADDARRTAARAESVGSAGIASDDENAPAKLAAKLARLEAERDQLKAFNRSCRKVAGGDRSLLDERQLANIDSITRHAPYQLGPGGSFPAYVLSNLGTSIRSVAKRIADVQGMQSAGELERSGAGWSMGEDDGRVVLTFDERTDEPTHAMVRAAGFVWSPSRKAFVRKLTPNARITAGRLADRLPADSSGATWECGGCGAVATDDHGIPGEHQTGLCDRCAV